MGSKAYLGMNLSSYKNFFFFFFFPTTKILLRTAIPTAFLCIKMCNNAKQIRNNIKILKMDAISSKSNLHLLDCWTAHELWATLLCPHICKDNFWVEAFRPWEEENIFCSGFQCLKQTAKNVSILADLSPSILKSTWSSNFNRTTGIPKTMHKCPEIFISKSTQHHNVARRLSQWTFNRVKQTNTFHFILFEAVAPIRKGQTHLHFKNSTLSNSDLFLFDCLQEKSDSQAHQILLK